MTILEGIVGRWRHHSSLEEKVSLCFTADGDGVFKPGLDRQRDFVAMRKSKCDGLFINRLLWLGASAGALSLRGSGCRNLALPERL